MLITVHHWTVVSSCALQSFLKINYDSFYRKSSAFVSDTACKGKYEDCEDDKCEGEQSEGSSLIIRSPRLRSSFSSVSISWNEEWKDVTREQGYITKWKCQWYFVRGFFNENVSMWSADDFWNKLRMFGLPTLSALLAERCRIWRNIAGIKDR